MIIISNDVESQSSFHGTVASNHFITSVGLNWANWGQNTDWERWGSWYSLPSSRMMDVLRPELGAAACLISLFYDGQVNLTKLWIHDGTLPASNWRASAGFVSISPAVKGPRTEARSTDQRHVSAVSRRKDWTDSISLNVIQRHGVSDVISWIPELNVHLLHSNSLLTFITLSNRFPLATITFSSFPVPSSALIPQPRW